MRKRSLIRAGNRERYLLTIALLALAPFAQGRPTPASANKSNDVAVILNDFRDAVEDGKSTPADLAALSSDLKNDLHSIGIVSPIAPLPTPPRRQKMPEPDSLFAWAIDLLGFTALIFFVRRRTAKQAI